MNLKFRLISAISALCFLGSVTCYSAAAANLMQRASGDDETPAVIEEPVVVEPAPYEPVTPVDPIVPADPIVEDPVVSYDPEPGYTYESTPAYDPGYEDPNAQTYSTTYSDVISEGNFPQTDYSQPESYVDYGTTTSTYVDNSYQYNQYIYNTTQAQYDDNYIYVPQYEEPTESLVQTESKSIDTDELSQSDWKAIMLDLSNGSRDGSNGDAKTFSFIKDNETEGDSDMMWMVYLGTALILASIFLVIFVIVSSTKEKPRAAI